MSALLTTAEAAAFLRIKERKLYDLVAARAVPSLRVGGKWVFPRAALDQWIAEKLRESGTALAAPVAAVVAGSHDPLLAWAVAESGADLALQTGGSLDGLRRLAEGKALLAGLHAIDGESGEYNTPFIRRLLPGQDVVSFTWASRSQGLIVAKGNPRKLKSLADALRKKARFVLRQAEAGSQILLLHLLRQSEIEPKGLRSPADPARSETDLGLAILEGRADCGIGIEAAARPLGLGFVPLAVERFDLVTKRRDYFEAPIQKLLAFARRPAFAARAKALGGYDLRDFGKITYNGP
ncbi:MAG: helix-turn-helix domain-containing protein [Alphaproteobacteria bacterium]|nr:helix-turn-helix domain-containing protein [Alphaproteobacteria bacterium]